MQKYSLVVSQTIAAYRDEIRRLYGNEIANKTELAYRHGWYYVNIARRFPDGSVGTLPSFQSCHRRSALIGLTENLRQRKPREVSNG